MADGNKPPIDKACGEGLMPDSRMMAERLGISLPPTLGYEFRGIRFLWRRPIRRSELSRETGAEWAYGGLLCMKFCGTRRKRPASTCSGTPRLARFRTLKPAG